MKLPLVSIITVNYKEPVVTCELLDSIKKLSYPNLEVIIVDNAQTYDDTPLYKAHYDKVKVINSPENLGFAGGNNLGIQAAKGDFLFFVNNDTELNDSNIQTLVMAHGDPSIGAISPILRYYENPDLIQFTGFTTISPLTGRNKTIKRKRRTGGVVSTPYMHGAAVMVKREVVEKCGMMPEDYFLYYEEFAWSENIKRKGYKLKVSMDTEVLHKESVTTGKNSPLKVYYQTRNRLVFLSRYNRSIYKLPFKLFFCSLAFL